MQRLAEHGDQPGGLGEAQAASTEPGRQVAPVHVFGHDVTSAVVGPAHVVDRHDVRVGEPGDDPGFVEVRLDVHGPGRLDVEGDLDGDVPVELRVVGQVDPTETALAQDPDHAVSADVGRGRLRAVRRRVARPPGRARLGPGAGESRDPPIGPRPPRPRTS